MRALPRLDLVALVLCALATPAFAAGDPAKGEKIFARCKACHSLQAGENKTGPSLAGIVGRESGSVEGFEYSDAMREAAIVWDETALDSYLAAPRGYVPGNKMLFPGLKKEQDRQDVIAYLEEAAAAQ